MVRDISFLGEGGINVKRNIVLWCICLVLIFSGTSMANTKRYSTVNDVAVALSELGLFRGTDQGFALEDIPKRIQGLVMLIRLTGNEKAALAETESHPFKDVEPWADPYVAFAYKQQWIKGIEEGKFGAEEAMNEQQYLTLLLRALGYTEEAGDFSWETVNQLAADLGLSADLGQTLDLTRGRMVLISWDTLKQHLKESEETLAEVLEKKQMLDFEKYNKIKNEIMRPEIITGFLNCQDMLQIATTYGKSFEDVKQLFTELLYQAKEVTPQKGIQAWVLTQIKEIKAELSGPAAQSFDQMVQELWKDFWNQVDGKIKP